MAGTYQDYLTKYLNQSNPMTGRGYYTDDEAASALGVTPQMVNQWKTNAQLQNPLLQSQLGGQNPADIFKGIYGTSFNPANTGAIVKPTATATPTAGRTSALPAFNETSSARTAKPATSTNATMPVVGMQNAWPPFDTSYTDASNGTPPYWGGGERGINIGFGWPSGGESSGRPATPTTPRPTNTVPPYNPGVVNPSGRPTTNQVPRGGTGGINPNVRGVPGGAPTAGSWIRPALGTAAGLYGAFSGNGNNYAFPSGGSFEDQLKSLITGSAGAVTPYLNNVGNYPMSPLTQALAAYMGNQSMPSLQSLFGNNAYVQGLGQSMYGQGTDMNSMIGNWLQQIYTQGMPNQQAIQNLVNPQIGTSNALMGSAGSQNPYAGLNSPYGVQQLLQQVMAQGLPGQQNITNMGNSLAQQSTTGGLTPEIVNAYKQLILQPQQQALQGSLNRQGGGVAEVPQIDQYGNMTNPGSGLLGELMNRNQQQFQNQLLTQGFQQQPQLANAATGAFGQVAGSAAPYVSMAGNFGNQGIQNALSAYGIIPSSISPYFNTGASMGTSLSENGLNALLQGNQQGNQLYNNYLSQLLGMTGQQNTYALGQQGQQNDILRTLLSGMFGNQASQAQIDAANKAMWSQIIGQALNAAPGLYDLFRQIFH